MDLTDFLKIINSKILDFLLKSGVKHIYFIVMAFKNKITSSYLLNEKLKFKSHVIFHTLPDRNATSAVSIIKNSNNADENHLRVGVT